MKNFKKLLSLALAVLMAATMFGCGKKGGLNEETAKELQKDVLQNVDFEQKLYELNQFTIGTYYALPQGAEVTAYVGSAIADQIAVFHAADCSVKELEDLLIAETKELKELYAGYDTSELNKISHAIIETSGDYVIFCITDDYEAAQKIIDKYI